MSRDDLAERLRATFAAELEDLVKALNAEVLALERIPDDAVRLKAVFRGAHTIKGAARAAGVPSVEQLCHALETWLADIRDGRQTLRRDDYGLLFHVLDALSGAARALRQGGAVPDGDLSAVTRAVVERQPGGAAPPTLATPVTPATRTSDGYERAQSMPGDLPVIRIQAAKVEKLLTATTQIMIDRTRFAERHARIRELHDVTARWAGDWQRLGRSLRLSVSRGHGDPRAMRSIGQLDERLRQLVRETGRLSADLGRDARSLEQAIEDLAHHTHQVRLRPFAEACEHLPRTVRDVATASGKDVTLVLEGQEIELERAVVDGLRDALLPLVRNAVDHGVETPDVRASARKPRTATVRVTAATVAERVVVTVADDGVGLDIAAIRQALAERGVETSDDAATVAEALLHHPVSTRAEATTISGRGVGLDIVRAAVDGIRGTLEVVSTPGHGTTVRLECPPTLATLRGVLVRVGSYRLVLPTAHVQRLLRVGPERVRQSQSGAVLTGQEEAIRLVALGAIFGQPFPDRAVEARTPVVLLTVGQRRLAVMVDELITQREFVVRPLPTNGGRRLVSGATVLGDGGVATVVDVPAVVAEGLGAEFAVTVDAKAAAGEKRRSRILVVDDSITTRTLEQSVLEAAGFDVLTAVDGADAWRVLQEHGCDLVVADVEMPRMDGFDLTEAIRGTPRFKALPVILVTALESADHRRRGLEVGADAYIGKSGFDQENLLETIRQLLD